MAAGGRPDSHTLRSALPAFHRGPAAELPLMERLATAVGGSGVALTAEDHVAMAEVQLTLLPCRIPQRKKTA